MYYVYVVFLMGSFAKAEEESFGCGGFIISHVEIDYTKIEVKLYAKNGFRDEITSCAPSSGYYFFPIYDKGDYVLELLPPAGWSLTPSIVHISIDGKTDLCSKGEDINFYFKGFGITGIVESYGTTGIGPKGVTVELMSDVEVRRTVTKEGGTFFFTPVYPGHYTVSISHKLWRIFKQSVKVNVNEENTELPLGSLVIRGYDVTGYVKSDGHSADGIVLVLFQGQHNEKVPSVDGCKKTIIKDLEQKGKQLCHISSSLKGNFTFDVLSSGHYFIIPYYKGQHVHFQPEIIKFEVTHASVILPETFKIVGFTIMGYVRTSEDGKPLKNANVFVNGIKVSNTKEDGSYVLENVKADSYTISISAENMQFETITLRINQHVLEVPDFFPSLYKVCGSVLSEQEHNVLITRAASTRTFTTKSEFPDGKFCVNLSCGKYSMKVILKEEEKLQGVQFFPTSYDFEIIDGPVLGITFSQLKATVIGKVICSNREDCIGINIILKLVQNESPAEQINIVTLLNNGTYVFENVRQGNYEVSLAPNKFCWKKPARLITVSSTNELVAPFIQSGYMMVFVSSHSSKVLYKMHQQEKSINIAKGRTSLCLEKPGSYEFKLKSCHIYESDSITHNTNSKEYEVYLTAIKHTVVVEIECEENYGDLYMIVNMDGVKRQEGPLAFKDKRYFISLVLKPSDSVILVPHSEVLFVYPPILSINGQDDCTNLGVKFRAKKGRIFVGNIIPPLQGVLITVETDNSDTLSNETDVEGRYRFPPQDDSKQYKVFAKKDSYVLFGPDEQGDFIAHKLAEITVDVVFEDNNGPLQGVLLSLSGGQGYRKNIPTGDDGVVTFHSLTPGEYFLKPMKKEYSFEPSTKLIVAEEGITIPITLKGKRFAYSGYGQMTSLNNDPEEQVTVLASGLGNCSRLFEEATSESNGQFRIRGLHPYCTYNVKVKHSSEGKRIERGSPSSLNISVAESDVHGLKFTVFKSALNTDVMVRVYCKNPDLYKVLRISLSRESNPSGLIHTAKLENYKLTKNNAGIIVYLPSLPLDEKTYYIQVESSVSHTDTINGDIYYFISNSSFKYLDVDCHSQKGGPGQNIKQTSLWTLLIIFIILLGFYNIEYTVQVIKEQLSKLNIGHVIHKFKPLPAPTEFVIDKHEIDQIVESINPTKRKLKPRKT